MISLIAAIGKNNELGKNNQLIWKLPADLKYFSQKTKGHKIIMGRKTFESIGKILPNRENIIITRDKKYKVNNVEIFPSLEEVCRKYNKKNEEIFIIGGGEIYKQAISIADKLYITHIEAEDKKADTFFPEIIPVIWNEISHEEHKKNESNPFNYTFSVYEKFI